MDDQEKAQRKLKFEFMAEYNLSEKEFDELGYKVLECDCGKSYCEGWIIIQLN